MKLYNNAEELVFKGFSKHLLEKFGLLKYTKESGITVITIMYNADTKEGWLNSIAMSPIPKDQPDNR